MTGRSRHRESIGPQWKTTTLQRKEPRVIASVTSAEKTAQSLLTVIERSLDDDKADEIVAIDLAGKTNIADFMVVASGRSQRHVGAIAEHLLETLKARFGETPRSEGLGQCDWVLIDAGDVIVHLFRPEVRSFYNLEKLWSVRLPAAEQVAI